VLLAGGQQQPSNRRDVFNMDNPLVCKTLDGFPAQPDLNRSDVRVNVQAPVALGIPLYPYGLVASSEVVPVF
jgi:hypothetical protein